jgi:hypothetical protein
MKNNYAAAVSIMLTASSWALPDGWISADSNAGGGVAFINSSKTITLAPAEKSELSLEQMGEEMRNIYGNLGFDCRSISRSRHMVNFDCVKTDSRNPEMPSSVAIYLMESSSGITAASLVGGASYDDLKLIMGAGSL